VTSRLADFSGHFQPLELQVLAIEDAAAFLLERTKERRRVAPDDDAKAREVAEELGRLALALEQAAAFIGKRRLAFAQYLEQWRSKRDEVLAWFGPTMTDYPRSVAVTWQTSVAQLTEGGRRLLDRLAWLAPEKVPESLLDVPVPGAEAENLRDAYDERSRILFTDHTRRRGAVLLSSPPRAGRDAAQVCEGGPAAESRGSVELDRRCLSVLTQTMYAFGLQPSVCRLMRAP
jgi:hypothetical protein